MIFSTPTRFFPTCALARNLRPMFLAQKLVLVVVSVMGIGVGPRLLFAETPPAVVLGSNDVVAFVGGSHVAAAQHTGHVEALLTVIFPGARFRNFGWEGDTVFAQPRDFGFPPLSEHLKRAEVSVLFIEFGRAEALNGKETVPQFFAAYEKLVTENAKRIPRIVLVTPPPFERGGALLPDLSKCNSQLAANVNAIRTLAGQRGLPVVNLFDEFGGVTHEEPRLTDDGLQITPRGHALIAAGFARQLGFPELAARAGSGGPNGVWTDPELEKLRQITVEKNRLWFNYWRPQNWAFLGGDRTSQPSSRDHRNPNVRWFPVEMEKYAPLIMAKEMEMQGSATVIRGGAE